MIVHCHGCSYDTSPRPRIQDCRILTKRVQALHRRLHPQEQENASLHRSAYNRTAAELYSPFSVVKAAKRVDLCSVCVLECNWHGPGAPAVLPLAAAARHSVARDPHQLHHRCWLRHDCSLAGVCRHRPMLLHRPSPGPRRQVRLAARALLGLAVVRHGHGQRGCCCHMA